jgi:hypothetical protein
MLFGLIRGRSVTKIALAESRNPGEATRNLELAEPFVMPGWLNYIGTGNQLVVGCSANKH